MSIIKMLGSLNNPFFMHWSILVPVKLYGLVDHSHLLIILSSGVGSFVLALAELYIEFDELGKSKAELNRRVSAESGRIITNCYHN